MSGSACVLHTRVREASRRWSGALLEVGSDDRRRQTCRHARGVSVIPPRRSAVSTVSTWIASCASLSPFLLQAGLDHIDQLIGGLELRLSECSVQGEHALSPM
jgi:hypothetical protein